MAYSNTILILLVVAICFLPSAHAFGAGNIASISAIEGKNWRHGDIEDMLKTITCLKHHKWTSMMIKRVYFGNWLRDYSQAMDTGALKKAQPETIRILVWLLSFLSFGYATAEFEVTSERLGVYRPEEHIDNPRDYNDNEDARKYDPRLRGPVRPIELEIDPETGMKNYIANGKGDWATSAAFVKYSFERSIHHGRLYTSGHGFFKGKDEDLAEALRLLGQGLHCLEDFGAHSNYTELALREQGHHNVFCHTGSNTQINLHGKQVFPLVTGTFGMVDFYHSVLGEATDHFTQSEVNEMDNALGVAQTAAQSSNPLTTLIKLLSKVPGTRELCAEAEALQRMSNQRARELGMPVIDTSGWYGGSRDIGDSEQSRVTQPDYSAPEAVYPDQHPGNWNQPPQQPYQQPQWNSPQHPQSFNMADSSAYGQPPPQYSSQGGFQQQQSNFNQQAPWEQQPQQQQPVPQHAPWEQQTQQQQPVPQHASWEDQSQQAPSQQTQSQPPPDVKPQPTPSTPQQAPTSAPEGLPGLPEFDAAATIKQIYPILAFRDKVVRTISAVIEKIPGLEAIVDRITETLTIFILSLLAPFVRPVISGISKLLQSGSGAVVDASGRHQYEPWTDPNCTDPTHSLLSKDHFSNILNEPAGQVASAIITFIAPRVLYAWEHPDVPLSHIQADVEKVFHHPATRDTRSELHNSMFSVVEKWARSTNLDINTLLSAESVRAGKNHIGDGGNPHVKPSSGQHASQPQQFLGMPHLGGSGGGGALGQISSLVSNFSGGGQGHGGGSGGGVGGLIDTFTHAQGVQHHGGGGGGGGIGGLIDTFTHAQGGGGGGQHHGGGGGNVNEYLNLASKLPIPGVQGLAQNLNKYSKYAQFLPGGGSRELEVGGRRELLDAEANANRGDEISRGTSPMPPTGYEEYGGRSEYRADGYGR